MGPQESYSGCEHYFSFVLVSEVNISLIEQI